MPPRIVIDTNVIYAALRSKSGASYQILDAIWARKITILLSQTVLMEYEEILKQYAPTLGLTYVDVDTLLDLLSAVCQKFEMNTPWSPILQDADDEAFVRLAVSGRADYLITHNLRHFEPARSLGIKLLAPGEFLATINL